LAHGLKQEPASGRVFFPPDEVDRAIASTPRSFTLYNRNGQPHATLGGENVHFVPGSSGVKVLDHRTGETRSATTTDFVDYVRLADNLPHIAYLATAFSTNDIGRSLRCLAFVSLSTTLKPVVSGALPLTARRAWPR
jgi:trimethylamine--corrinoid protein Co-methyltransferase